MSASWNVVVVGLSITSSWGNGHATTYRSLLRAFSKLGHSVLFLERDVPWYRDNRDLPSPDFCQLGLYSSVEELKDTWASAIKHADMVILGSYTPEGATVATWLRSQVQGALAFYDIDTPITLAALRENRCEYLEPDQVQTFDVYLSFTGGPTLQRLEGEFGAGRARALYCCADEQLYFPEPVPTRWNLGYMGTYSTDRQPAVDALLLQPAAANQSSRFVVVGPQYPTRANWPPNVEYVDHLPPAAHREFYNSQRFTLNVTRRDMLAAGYSPSVRLFEAAACATPIISDYWNGIDTFFQVGTEILVARTTADCCGILNSLTDEERVAIGRKGRERMLKEHTASHRALQLQRYLAETIGSAAAQAAEVAG